MSFTVICNTCKKQRVIQEGFGEEASSINVVYQDENDTILVSCDCNNIIESDEYLRP